MIFKLPYDRTTREQNEMCLYLFIKKTTLTVGKLKHFISQIEQQCNIQNYVLDVLSSTLIN